MVEAIRILMGSPKQGTPRISEEPSGNIRTLVGIFLSYSDYILEVPCLCPGESPFGGMGVQRYVPSQGRLPCRVSGRFRRLVG